VDASANVLLVRDQDGVYDAVPVALLHQSRLPDALSGQLTDLVSGDATGYGALRLATFITARGWMGPASPTCSRRSTAAKTLFSSPPGCYR
jgi:hypothetical protein